MNMTEIISFSDAKAKAAEEEERLMLINPDGDWELEHLRQAIFRCYRYLAADDAEFNHSAGTYLRDIGEHLDWCAVDQFGATHVQLLERLIAYWRECTACAGAPQPRAVIKAEDDEGVLLSQRGDTLLLRNRRATQKDGQSAIVGKQSPRSEQTL
jgi:hypothetical protein